MHPNYDGILVWFILHESATVRMLSLAPSLLRLCWWHLFFGKPMLVALSWWVKIEKFLLLPRIVLFFGIVPLGCSRVLTRQWTENLFVLNFSDCNNDPLIRGVEIFEMIYKRLARKKFSKKVTLPLFASL